MKPLHESLLDPDFDIKDPSPCAMEVFKLLDSSDCRHLDGAPLQWWLLFTFPIQDKLYKIFSKYGKRISASTARRKPNAVVCRAPYAGEERELYIKLRGNVFEAMRIVRTVDEYHYVIQYSPYRHDIQYTAARVSYDYYEIPEDVADVIYKEFEYFSNIKYKY